LCWWNPNSQKFCRNVVAEANTNP